MFDVGKAERSIVHSIVSKAEQVATRERPKADCSALADAKPRHRA